ncbi:hypothetical protein [Streptomyces sp. NPDC059256]|uniref:hypothetical protein n=1 Tax=Streptomyces sp. NPDC059256 TaxID=3346794 RepID=UPI003684F50E
MREPEPAVVGTSGRLGDIEVAGPDAHGRAANHLWAGQIFVGPGPRVPGVGLAGRRGAADDGRCPHPARRLDPDGTGRTFPVNGWRWHV